QTEPGRELRFAALRLATPARSDQCGLPIGEPTVGLPAYRRRSCAWVLRHPSRQSLDLCNFDAMRSVPAETARPMCWYEDHGPSLGYLAPICQPVFGGSRPQGATGGMCRNVAELGQSGSVGTCRGEVWGPQLSIPPGAKRGDGPPPGGGRSPQAGGLPRSVIQNRGNYQTTTQTTGLPNRRSR